MAADDTPDPNNDLKRILKELDDCITETRKIQKAISEKQPLDRRVAQRRKGDRRRGTFPSPPPTVSPAPRRQKG